MPRIACTTVRSKIYFLLFALFAAFAALIAFQVMQLASGLREQKRIELKNLVDMALSIAREEHAAAASKQISAEEAKERAAKRIGMLRYASGDYFWINDFHPRMVMHPIQPQLNGQDLTNNRDPNGKALFLAFVDTVRRHGSGFVDYEWPKPGAEGPQPKLSYVAGFAPWEWIIGTGVYIDDLSAQIWAAARLALIAVVSVMLAAGAFAFVFAARIGAALHTMTSAMNALANGDTSAQITIKARRDEIGDMAKAVEVFRANAIERIRLESEQKEAQARSSAERKAMLHGFANQFEAAVGKVIDTVSAASTELEAAAATLTSTATRTQQLSEVVASASEDASSNVQSVAAATEELTASVQEISRQAQDSSQIASEAVEQAAKTDARMAKLSEAAGRIGEVVKLITAIAEQTNLLALNATIEAARAGEAGRGFAVVAQEVKALAAQTAKATDEIGQQIASMQTATGESVTSIKEIGATIKRMSEIASMIAAAVTEQGAATQEISQNVQRASQGTSQVACNIGDVNRGAGETGSASSQVLTSAQMLSRESHALSAEVAKFLETVRAA